LQDVQSQVGRKIRKLRLQKGFTQDGFALTAGLNRSHYYRVEGGKQNLTLISLKIIADALGVRVRDLVWEL
jgi:transcriptional regulator with XRE-family HTH domain